jgi:metal transporter CNNM
MTSIQRVYMLEASAHLDYETMLQIYKSGYTRIPVYEGDRPDPTRAAVEKVSRV